MTVVNPKSISGINSITTGSGSDDLLTIHNNSGAERFRVDGSGNTRITSGIVTTISIGAVSSVGDIASVGAITGDISIDDKIIHNGDTNTALRFPTADTVSVETGGSEAIRIDSSQRLLVGNTTSLFGDQKLQVTSTTHNGSLLLGRWTNNAYSSYLNFYKSRNGSIVDDGSGTIVQNNDQIGNISFYGDDATANRALAAEIVSEVDNTPGTNDMPGRIILKTSGDGSDTPTERFRINSVGKVGINSTAPDGTLAIEAVAGGEPVLTMRNHPAAGVYSGNYGVEYRHAYGSVNHGMLIHTQEAANGRRALDVSDSNGVFATFTNGKVGIGSEIPTQKLDVNGLIKITGSGGQGLNIENSGGTNASCINLKNTLPSYVKEYRIAVAGSDGAYATASSLFVRDQTSGANRFEIQSGGDVKVSTGDLYFGTAGKGIVLGATSNTAANTLDDYEEGTWTAAIAYAGGSGWSTSEGNGKYIKIGHLVHCTVLLSWNEGSGSGAVSFSGLPFTIKNDSHTRLGGHAIYLDGFSNLSGSNIFLYNTGNSTNAYMYYVSGDNDSHLGPSDSDVSEANTSNTNTTRFMFHYQSA